jgi:hypothetical protein
MSAGNRRIAYRQDASTGHQTVGGDRICASRCPEVLGGRSDPPFEAFAAREPYFAVLTDPRFLRANLTAEYEREFFASGEDTVSGCST